MNGSNLGIKDHFHINLGTTYGRWLFGVTNAVPFLVGGIMYVIPLMTLVYG
jgi:hypothetical protein